METDRDRNPLSTLNSDRIGGRGIRESNGLDTFKDIATDLMEDRIRPEEAVRCSMSFRDGWNPDTVQLKELYEAKFNQYRALKAEVGKYE